MKTFKAGKKFLVFFFVRAKWVCALAISPPTPMAGRGHDPVSGGIGIQLVTKQSVET